MSYLIVLAINPYVIIRGEDDTVKSFWFKDELNPQWNCKAIFYRKKIDQPIIVEVSFKTESPD